MQEPANQERRAWVRYPSTPYTPFSVVAEPDYVVPQKAWVQDLSAAGVGLVVTGQVAPGTVVDVILARTTDGSTRVFQARVVRCNQNEAGWLIGCTFTHPLHEDELREFI